LDDLFWVFFIIFFIVAPILEKVLKRGRGGQQQQQQQQRRGRLPGSPPPRPGLPGRPVESRTPAPSPRGTSDRDATDLVPADLWEVLTGQRRMEPSPPPADERALARPRTPDSDFDELESWELTAPRQEAPPPVASSEDRAVDELLRRRDREARILNAPPVIVSLETAPLSEARRHDAFHRKLAALPAPALSQTPVSKRAGMPDLSDRDALQRAIILHEVLGPPKGFD
jgi:hypothetical protein